MEPPTATLQLILPTDKRNPCFTLYQTQDGQFIHVYYGVERLEVVPAVSNHPAYRMLVARLYNADVKVSALEKLFDLDHKTIRAWGMALESGDPDALQRMLFGQPRKLTPAIKEFIASRWPSLLAQHCRNYRQVLQTEIKNYFGVNLSGESLRIMMNQITQERGGSTELAAAAPDLAPSPPEETRADPPSGDALEMPEDDLFAPAKPPNPVGEPPIPESVASKCIPCCGQTTTSGRVSPAVSSSHFKSTASPTPESSELPPICEVVEVVTDPNFGEWTCFSSAVGHADDPTPGEPEIPAATHLDKPPEPVGEPPVPDWFACKFDSSPWQPEPGEATLCDHAGVMIFAHALASLPAVVDPPQPILGQWLAATLLGAHNIEQTKLLNGSDLGLLLGTVVRFPAPQRVVLGTLATPETVAAVLRWNFQQLGESVTQCNDFYLDQHTKHYTGMQRVLKGWCASIRWADKVMHGDFIHTAQGHPVYFEWVDNYDDLRVRFLPLIERMRTTLCLDGTDPQAPPRVLTITVDRGIFSNNLFNHVVASVQRQLKIPLTTIKITH